MKRRIKLILTICLLTITIVLFVTTIYRVTWVYNENGVHFDEDSMTTYDEGAIIAYGILTIVFLVPTIILFRSLRKAANTNNATW
jgi:hypothetical protein